MEREVLKLQKNELIHVKMSDFVLNLGRNLSYYGEDAWTDQKRPLYMDEKNISKLGTPIAHGRKYFFICGYMESNIFLCNFVSQKGR